MKSFLKNPLSELSHQILKKALWILGFSALMLMLVINIADKPLKTSMAPDGIVSFELAGELTQTQNILTSWDAEAKMYAAFSLGIDYLFLLMYSLFFFMLIFQISQSIREKYPSIFRIGFYLAYAQFIAALFDGIENYFLIRLLFGADVNVFSQLAFYFASLKFILIFLGLLYLITGIIIRSFFLAK